MRAWVFFHDQTRVLVYSNYLLLILRRHAWVDLVSVFIDERLWSDSSVPAAHRPKLVTTSFYIVTVVFHMCCMHIVRDRRAKPPRPVEAHVWQRRTRQVRVSGAVPPAERPRAAGSTSNTSSRQDGSGGTELHRREPRATVHWAADVRSSWLVRRLALLCSTYLRPVTRRWPDGCSVEVRGGSSLRRLENSDHFSWPGTGAFLYLVLSIGYNHYWASVGFLGSLTSNFILKHCWSVSKSVSK